MKIIVIGAGDVGAYISQILSESGHEIIVIEANEALINSLDEVVNAKFINDNGATSRALRNAKVEEADYVLAMTTNDAVNLVSCSIAKTLGASETIARIHHETYSDCNLFNYQLQFGVDYMINPEALCALELAKAIRNPGRVAVESFARGQIEVQQVTISKNSKFVDIPLKDLPLGQNVRIGYVTKNSVLTIARANTILEENDVVIVIGTPERIFELKPQLDPEIDNNQRRITLYGGTETAIMLANILSPSKFLIRFIESNPATCEALAKQFTKATIIQGDATSLRLLEEEQIGDADFFVACTKDDEDNIMTCVQAKRLGAEHVQLVINKPDYEPVLEDISKALGVELAVSPREATIKELLRYISKKPILELACLPDGKTKIVKITLPHDSPQIEQRVRDVPWPSPSLVMGLIRKYRAKVPHADDVLLPGDKLLMIIEEENIPQLRSLLL